MIKEKKAKDQSKKKRKKNGIIVDLNPDILVILLKVNKLNILIHDKECQMILKFSYILFKRHVLNKGHKKDKIKG